MVSSAVSPVALYIRYTFLHIVFRAQSDTACAYFEECCVLGCEDVSYWTYWRIVLHEYNFRLQMFAPR